MLGRKPVRTVRDAFIAETALLRGLTPVTADARLANGEVVWRRRRCYTLAFFMAWSAR
jgi:hypothetical protein